MKERLMKKLVSELPGNGDVNVRFEESDSILSNIYFSSEPKNPSLHPLFYNFDFQPTLEICAATKKGQVVEYLLDGMVYPKLTKGFIEAGKIKEIYETIVLVSNQIMMSGWSAYNTIKDAGLIRIANDEEFKLLNRLRQK